MVAKNRNGTLPWLIEQYKKDPKYKGLRDSTKKPYGWLLDQLLIWSAEKGDPPAHRQEERREGALDAVGREGQAGFSG